MPQPHWFLQVRKLGDTVKNLYFRTDWGAVDSLTSVPGE